LTLLPVHLARLYFPFPGLWRSPPLPLPQATQEHPRQPVPRPRRWRSRRDRPSARRRSTTGAVDRLASTPAWSFPATWPRQRDQPVGTGELGQIDQLGLPPNEAGQPDGQISHRHWPSPIGSPRDRAT
jgi:hypothetical protein